MVRAVCRWYNKTSIPTWMKSSRFETAAVQPSRLYTCSKEPYSRYRLVLSSRSAIRSSRYPEVWVCRGQPEVLRLRGYHATEEHWRDIRIPNQNIGPWTPCLRFFRSKIISSAQRARNKNKVYHRGGGRGRDVTS